MFPLLKLTLREKKLVTLAFLSTLFVAVFTYLFVDLVQPIIDEMFMAADAVRVSSGKTRVLDFLWRLLHVGRRTSAASCPLSSSSSSSAKACSRFSRPFS